MESGCTYPITTKTVTDAMKVEKKTLMKELKIIEEYRNIENCKYVSGGRSFRRKKDCRGFSNRRSRIKGNTNLAQFNEEVGFVPCVVPERNCIRLYYENDQ